MKMNKLGLSLAAALGTGALLAAAPVTVTLGTPAQGHDVPSSLWGIFYEDINWAADGGLSVETLANPGFDWGVASSHGSNGGQASRWKCNEDGWEYDFRNEGMARISIQMGAPVHPNTARHLRVETFGTGLAGVRNRGFDGIFLKAGEPYRLYYDWREIKRVGLDYELGAWTRVTKDFTFTGENQVFDQGSHRLVIEKAGDRWTLSILVAGRRAVEFDNVSLKPTGPNLVRAGLRKDLVDMLAGLKPAFMRFPGGCILEEGDFQQWYDWRRTVGPRERRECNWNRWGYWQTYDVGYYEFFRLCEEIGAEPLPICLAGLTCQYQRPTSFCSVKDIDYFTQAIFDLVEFANGGVDTKWGKVRAEMGHPQPFNLKKIGIGNENWGPEFWDRCEPIVKAFRAKYPEITVVGSVGPAPDGKNFDYAWKRATRESADLVDEHYYRSPDWFLNSAHRYDKYNRTTKPLVYAGEYACHFNVRPGVRPNVLWTAVCEAAAMTGFERNSDVVRMTSYAPLFARLGHTQWSPNLIWYDGVKTWATPNYYVQQMFSTNRPDRELPVTLSDENRFYACAGTTAGGETIVKLVNALEEPREVTLNLKGSASVITLAGKKLDDNTVERPLVVKPVTNRCELNGTYTVPACSVVVLRVAQK